MANTKVEALYTYPIKSCAGTELSEALVTPSGLELDRQFMVVREDASGNWHALTQREEPRLALVRPEVIEKGACGEVLVELSAPGMRSEGFHYDPSDDFPVTSWVELHKKTAVGDFLNDPTARLWLSNFLNYTVDLVRVANSSPWDDVPSPRPTPAEYQYEWSSNQTGFADAFSILLASSASLDELNKTVQQFGNRVGMDRFRPNIVVGGADLQPYAEDSWHRIRVGEMIAAVVKPCKRCSIPYVNQRTGKRTDSKTVGKALGLTRAGRNLKSQEIETGVYFGQNLAHSTSSEGETIKIGDTVEAVTERQTPNVLLRER
jgi:uncharacterized protein